MIKIDGRSPVVYEDGMAMGTRDGEQGDLFITHRKPLTGRVIAARARMREIGVDGNEPAKTRRA